MPNVLTNMKDTKVAQRALKAFTAKLGPVAKFSTNFSAEEANKNATVNVPVIQPSGASSDFAGSYIANIDSNGDGLPVSLNRHKFKTVHMTAAEFNSSSYDYMGDLVEGAVKRLAQDVYVDIMSIITAENFGAAALTLAANQMSFRKFLDLRAACNAVDMPEEDRLLLLDDAYHIEAMADDVINKSAVVPIAQGAVQGTGILNIAGFAVQPSTVIPANGEKLKGFACHPSAIAIVNRYMVPVAKYDEAGAVTDPETGLTYGYLRYSETSSNRVFVTVECLYGRIPAIAAAGQRICAP